MQEEHDGFMMGHCGERTTRVAIGKKFHWLEMKQNVKHFCAHFCQVSKHKIYIQKEIWVIGLYRPLSIPSKPWESVHGIHDLII